MGTKTSTSTPKPASSSVTTQAQSPVSRREVDKQPENPLQQPIWQPRPPGTGAAAGAPPLPPANPGYNFAHVPVLAPTPITVQAKLTVGEPNDKYEQEADHVADQVMRMPEPGAQGRPEDNDNDETRGLIQTKPISEQITPLAQRQTEEEKDEEEETVQTKPLIQRQEEPEDEEEEPVQTKLIQRQEEEEDEEEEPVQTKPLVQRQEEPEDEEEEEPVQTKAADKTPRVNRENEDYIYSIRGQGQPLPATEQYFFESRFGHNFGRVRVHADSKAARAARQINAQAFTVGRDIFFGANRYQPATTMGRRLLAHELTHTIQQNYTQPNHWKVNGSSNLNYVNTTHDLQRSHFILSRKGENTLIQRQNDEPSEPHVLDTTPTEGEEQSPEITDSVVPRSEELDTTDSPTTEVEVDRDSILQSESPAIPESTINSPPPTSTGAENATPSTSGEAVFSPETPTTEQGAPETTSERPRELPTTNQMSPQLASLIADIRGAASTEKAAFQQVAIQRRTALQQSIADTISQIENSGTTQSQALSSQIEARRSEVLAQYSELRNQVQQNSEVEKQQAATDAENVLLSIPQMVTEIHQEALDAAETEAELMENFGDTQAERVRSQEAQTIERLNTAKRNAAASVRSNDEDVNNAVSTELNRAARESISDVRDKGERTATAATNTANEVATSIRNGGRDVANSTQDTTQLEQGINETAQAVVGQIDSLSQASIARLDESEQRIMTNLDQANIEMTTAVQDVTQTAATRVHSTGEQVLVQLEQSESSILAGIDNAAEEAIASLAESGGEDEIPAEMLADTRSRILSTLTQGRQDSQAEYIAQADQTADTLRTGVEQFNQELGNVTAGIEQQLIDATSELQEVASIPSDVQSQSQQIRNEAQQTYTDAMQQWMQQAKEPIQQAQSDWQTQRSEAENEIRSKVDEFVTETNNMATQAVSRFNTTAREAAESASASLASRILSGIVEGLKRFGEGLLIFLAVFLVVFVVVLIVLAIKAGAITLAIVAAAAAIALAIVGIGFLIYGLVTSLIHRFSQAWELLGDRPWWEKLLIVTLCSVYFIAIAVGDVVGLTPLFEGIFGYDAMTFEKLSTEESWARITQGALTIIAILLLWRAGKAMRGRGGGSEPAQPSRPSPIIDPATGRPVGETPPPRPVIDPNTGRPVGEAPPQRPVIDPNTGRPVGETPSPRPIIDPNTGRPVGETPPARPVIDPNTGRPVGERPGRPTQPSRPRQPPQPAETPPSWTKFTPEHHPEFRARLREFRGNDNLEPTPGLRGGEGALWLAVRHPVLALKRWFTSRLADMPRSIQLLVDARAGVEGNPTLRSVIDVVRIHERGSDWIVRDFSPDSVPLRSALSDSAASNARATAIAELEAMQARGELTAALRNLLGKLRREPPSANLHWDPVSGKIIVIDMQ